MNLWDSIPYRKFRIYGFSILILVLLYVILRFFIFDSDPLIPFLSSLPDYYYIQIEKFANLILHWAGSPVEIQNHIILLNGIQLSGFQTNIIFEKFVVILILLIWITKTSNRGKIIYAVLFAIVSFIFASIYNAVGAHLLINNSKSISFLVLIPQNVGYLGLLALFFTWYRVNRENIFKGLKKLPFNKKLIKRPIFMTVFLASIIIMALQFVYNYFDFKVLSKVIFVSSQKVLSIFGYDAKAEAFLLIGSSGSISMGKPCLGLVTMFLFASIVFITGNDLKRRFFYMISGLLILIIANIIRMVTLFIYIQNHNSYEAAINQHHIYNIIIYFIVFFLWIIWFEKFSDIKRDYSG